MRPMLTKLVHALVFGCLLASCSAPVKPPPGAYPQNTAVSTSQGVPHDSTTSYFPAWASANTSKDSVSRHLGDCRGEFNGVSDYLFGFKAPVLSNYYLGHSIYRLLYLPAFRFPVLLTLDLHETSGVLKTKLLNRYPEPVATAAEVEAETQPAIERIKQLKSLIRAGQEVAINTERLVSATGRLNYIKLSGMPLLITEKVVVLNSSQIQQFLGLLDQVKIWQLPNCAPNYYLDGVSYVFEAHEAQRYKAISRSNPPQNGSFSKCCQFLINLSPAKPEPRRH